MNRVMVFAGTSTLIQAVFQLILTSFAIAQYFCIIDFLRQLPLLLYVRILYFHNPRSCGERINIGQSIDGIANQAFVLLTSEPFTAVRTLYINISSLALSVLWIITSTLLMKSGSRAKQAKSARWPWIMVTFAVCALDLVATVTYANDSFHTRTLQDMMNFIGATASGIAGANLDTAWAAWLMVLLYSRFVLIFLFNLLLIVLIILYYDAKDGSQDNIVHVEDPMSMTTGMSPATPPDPVTSNVPTLVPAPAPAPTLTLTPAPIHESPPTPPILPPPVTTADDYTSDREIDEVSLPSERPLPTIIPRPGLSQSFRRMKALLFKKSPTSDTRCSTNPYSLNGSPEMSPRGQPTDDKKRTVNFPESLLSLPQKLENLIAEQQRRLDKAVIDTSGRHSPPRASQSMPQLATTTQPEAGRGRRGTTAELQGQLPWAYIPASAHRMRDQLPPDEDLPPVPLPDYTAIPSFRKASVHRAASSLSSLTQKKDYILSQSARPPLTQTDVLY